MPQAPVEYGCNAKCKICQTKICMPDGIPVYLRAASCMKVAIYYSLGACSHTLSTQARCLAPDAGGRGRDDREASREQEQKRHGGEDSSATKADATAAEEPKAGVILEVRLSLIIQKHTGKCAPLVLQQRSFLTARTQGWWWVQCHRKCLQQEGRTRGNMQEKRSSYVVCLIHVLHRGVL